MNAGETSQGPGNALWQVYTSAHAQRLRMSRSLGDFYLKQRDDLPPEKQIVSPVPDIVFHQRSER